jgi:hypothetical protein
MLLSLIVMACTPKKSDAEKTLETKIVELDAAIPENLDEAKEERADTANSSSSRYLFEQNFAQNNITKIVIDSGELDSYVNLPNIGFSAGKRVIYNGTISLLDHIIHDSALAVLNKEELRLLRNTIYAKYGMIFQSNDLKKHFQQFDWYGPKSTNIEALLNDTDKANIGNIQLFENAVPNLEVTKSDLASDGKTYYPFFPVPSWCPELIIHNDNTIQRNGSYDDYEDNWTGTYRIENGFLVVFVTEQRVSDYYSKLTNWQWPDSETYFDGIITYRTPIQMTFPISNKIYLSDEYENDEYGDSSYWRIGSLRWF